MKFRNPKRTAGAAIDVEIMHPKLGWIPFAADRGDKGAGFDVGALVDRIEAKGGITDYVAPLPVPVEADPVLEALDLIVAEMPAGKRAAIQAKFDKARNK
jgi:hypothetical protein